MERVRVELERMIAGAAPQRAVRLLAESRLLHHIKEPLGLARLDTIKEMKALGELISPAARWAYIYLSLVISPSDVEEELKRLTFSKQQIKTIGSIHEAASLIGDRLRLEASEDASGLERIWKLAALQFGTKALSELLDIVKRDPHKEAQFAGISSGLLDILAMHGAAWLEELTVTNLAQLSVSGKELLSHVDRKAGPWMTALLQHLLEETALGHVENETDKLIDEAKRWVCNKLS
jgi:tRNA nucleotidyltransferase (CCA-adding enzyme)